MSSQLHFEPIPQWLKPDSMQMRGPKGTRRCHAFRTVFLMLSSQELWLVRLPSKLETSSRRSSKALKEQGSRFNEARIVEKVLSTLPERYGARISSLEDSRDLATISLTELINALYAQEQRRASRLEKHQEGAFQAKAKVALSTSAYKGKKNWKNRLKPDAARGEDRLCRFCKRPGHPEARCWFRPDAVCQHCKKKGNVERVCKEKGRPGQNQPQQKGEEARVAEDSSDHEKQVFAVSCLAGQDVTIFKTLDKSYKTRVKIGNGQFIKAEGKGDVLICTSIGDKVITNVLLVLEIDRNLLSIAQLLERGYLVVFKGQECQITDPN
ncbi:uncharacterized protein [Gossypium hirsutum]|uniref:Retrovirus-related Pol polyprotein from transposon TNT 1-94-like beta-barrel domain-containing protein n=1 Tax=Gossypium hirsutum TaxID=3635 RepID=A0A1U8MR42_GOSHI|nr:uncharacterized protein LOC107940368 [Gossypium hirsutum]